MIGYVTLGTNDLQRAAAFYDQLLSTLDCARMMETERFIAWNSGEGQAGLGLITPFDGAPATAGNGTMVALAASSPEQVNLVYSKALELGATDDGEPGFREALPGFYAGYFRDPDGNKLNVFCFSQSG